MASEKIGRLSVEVSPDFDQAELFKQLKAASAKLPALNVKPRILAKDANAAIREVNKKKLVKLNLEVSISAKAVNSAIRVVNGKKLIALKPPVELTAREVNKAIREVNRKRIIPIKTTLEIKEVSKTSKQIRRLNQDVKSTTSGISKLNRALFVGDQTTKGLGARLILLRYVFVHLRIAALGTAFGAVAQAISNVTAGVVALTSALSPGLVGGLAAAGVGALAFGQALGVIAIASAGVKQAFGDLNKAIDPKKFANLTPAAKQFVLELDKIRPIARGVQQSLQEELFTRLTKAIKIIIPLVKDFVAPLQQTARTLGDLSIEAANLISLMSGRLTGIMAANNIIIGNLGESALQLSQALIIVLRAAAPLAVVISNTTKKTATLVNQFIQGAEQSGRLAHFFVVAGSALAQMGHIAKNLGRVLINVFVGAFPAGSELLSLLTEATEKLAIFTSKAGTKDSIAKFFTDALPALKEFGGLAKDIALAFLRMATQPGLIIIISKLREVVPILEKAIERITREFAPVLVGTLSQFVIFFSELTSATGPLNIIVRLVGTFLGFINQVAQQHPGIFKLASALFVTEAALAAIQLRIIVFKSLGISSVFVQLGSLLTGVTTGAITFSGALGAIGAAIGGLSARFGILVARAGGFLKLAGRIAGVVGIIVSAIVFLKDTIGQFIKRLEDGQGIWEATWKSFAFATVKFVREIVGAIGSLLNALNELSEVSVKGHKINLSLGAFDPKSFKAIEKDLKGLEGSLEFKGGNKGSNKLVGPELTPQIKAQIEAAKQQKAIQKQINKFLKDGQKNYQDLLQTGVLTNDQLKEATRSTADVTKDALQQSADAMREHSDLLGEALDRQKDKVDKLKDALEELKNAQLEGTQAFSDARFALDQQAKALELQEVDLKLAGVAAEDPSFKALEDQLERIRLEAQKTDLTENLQLDPLRRQFDSLVNPIKELSFEKAVSEFNRLSAEQVTQNTKLEKLQKRYDGIQLAIKATERAARQLTGTFQNQVATLPPTARDGGAEAGAALLKGLETGARSELTKGSDFHKLLNEEIPKFIKDNKGPISVDRQILVPAGVAIMQGLTTGLRRGFEPVKGYLRQVGPSMEEYVPDSMFSKRTAEFMVEVAAGKKPDPKKFFGGLVPTFDPINFEAGSLGGPNPFKAIEAMFGLQRSSGDFDPPGVHAAGSYHYRKAPWGGVQAYDYGDARNSVSSLLAVSAFAKRNASLFAEAFYDKFGSYVDNGQVIQGQFGGHGDHVHLAFKSAISEALGGKVGGRPTKYDSIIAAAAGTYKISAALIKAVIQAESGFNPRAGSGAGAQGLMQLLPSTFAAQHVGGNIFNPTQNINAGAKYLKAQLDKFHDVKLALAAYNAGPGAVRSHGGIPPFAETIAYIARVLKYLSSFGGFRAMGGPVGSGRTYMVGERGPELFVPRRNGQVITNKNLEEMLRLLREIRDTGGLRQQTTTVTTAAQDPRVVAELLEIQQRRRARRIKV